MKYGKLLQLLLEQMPVEYRDKFLSYKQLKKVINTILQDNSLPVAAFVEVEEGGEGEERAAKRAKGDAGVAVAAGGEEGEREGGEVVVGGKRKVGEVEGVVKEALAARQVAVRGKGGEEKELTNEEETFLQLLNKELEKFNSFFTEKEEEYVIRLQELKNMLEKVRHEGDALVHPSDRSDDLMTIRIDLVTLHGELILMESYSTLNYTGLVKILKKHDKRTGAVLRLPFIRRVLLQPFFSTELLSQLVKQCSDLLSTFPPTPREVVDDPEDASSLERPYATGPIAEGIFKGTVAALRTIQEMRKGSSTVSPLSLPPCDLKENSWSGKFSDHLRNQEPESMPCAS
ncbi:hypothetical protein KC19_6G093700 [Ceratodon purpureus]|uniref:SPX domain-containing protein n=1 Tax=Ceratodon purpureus TaxID=3225 RepID=A0A8T0HEU5_CERPU|nr:hypothetical protein KC19_6G093700 [Ceratodon purpureus]